jgi:hypothetical protein
VIAYTSRTGTRTTLEALRAAGWRLLVSAANDHRHEGMPYALDNGAWTYHQRGVPFDVQRFLAAVETHGERADFVVVPDVVADASASLRMAERWLPVLAERLRPTGRGVKLLIAVQDGMQPADVTPWLCRTSVGIFLGGSTDWKIETMRRWGTLAEQYGSYYHVARVNTVRRIRMAAEAGADSFDGSSPVQFPSTLPRLDAARREGTLARPHPFLDLPRDYEDDAVCVERELPTYRDDEQVTMHAGALRALLRRTK